MKNIILIILINTILSGSVLCNELKINEILERMQKQEKKIKDVKLEFVQELEFKTVQEKYKTEARLVYKKHPSFSCQPIPIDSHIKMASSAEQPDR